jgi:hypothetical protein
MTSNTALGRLATGFALLLAASMPGSARAEFRENGQLVCTGAMAAVFNKQLIATVNQSWAQIDAETQQCVASRAGASPAQLAARCIAANDSRVAGYVQACRQTIESARQAREAEGRRVAAQREAEARRNAAQAEAREKERQAVAAEKQRAEIRRAELIEKYGEQTADAIVAGKVIKDMPGEAVIAVRGPPPRKETIPPAYELWIYGTDRIALTNGKVTFVGQ